ncbi:MAG TPA: type II toxin-antitoxin system CcdA family antitoxin [Acidimicrobiales bacterium]|nr:type II toxin-antitoxin system CcdA family antitoxin [Acidimicrobiales bacterium]
MSKGRITVTVDQALLDRARSLGVNLSAACERGIAEVTETLAARVELARQVADYEDAGGVYDDEKLARARQVLAEVHSALGVERRAG